MGMEKTGGKARDRERRLFKNPNIAAKAFWNVVIKLNRTYTVYKQIFNF
jgi:hypothetical protein